MRISCRCTRWLCNVLISVIFPPQNFLVKNSLYSKKRNFSIVLKQPEFALSEKFSALLPKFFFFFRRIVVSFASRLPNILSNLSTGRCPILHFSRGNCQIKVEKCKKRNFSPYWDTLFSVRQYYETRQNWLSFLASRTLIQGQLIPLNQARAQTSAKHFECSFKNFEHVARVRLKFSSRFKSRGTFP